MVRHCNLTHKPDRNPAGAFFQATAYRRVTMEDDRIRLAVRVPLIDLTDAKDSLEKARKGIGDIVSPETRCIVSDEFERRISTGKSAKEALSEPVPDPRYEDKTNGNQSPIRMIRKVRVFQRIGRGFVNGENAVPVIHESRNGEKLHKYYLKDGYAYVSLKSENGKLISAESVSLWAAACNPATRLPNETRYYPNETMLDTDSKRKYVVRQIKADAVLMLTLATEAREVRDMDADTGLKMVSGQGLLNLRHA